MPGQFTSFLRCRGVLLGGHTVRPEGDTGVWHHGGAHAKADYASASVQRARELHVLRRELGPRQRLQNEVVRG